MSVFDIDRKWNAKVGICQGKSDKINKNTVLGGKNEYRKGKL